MKLQINKEDLEELKSILNVYPIIGIIYTILIMIYYPTTNIFITILFPFFAYIINYGILIAYILYKNLRYEKDQ